MFEIYKIQRNGTNVEKIECSDVKETLKDSETFLWIDIEKPACEWPDNEEMAILKGLLKIHFLTLEDCIAKKHFPKVEDHKNYVFLIMSRMYEREDKELDAQKISFIVAKNFVVSYENTDIKEVDLVKKLLKTQPQDFNDPVEVFYSIADRIADEYITLIDGFSVKIDQAEEELFHNPESKKVLHNINLIRKNLIVLRRNTYIQREMFYDMFSGKISFEDEKKNIYFKDIYDHLDRVLGKIENQKDYLAGLINVQIGLSGQKLNALVKFLTIISAILLPATLLAGVFGMNFESMPFIGIKAGFYLVLGVMLVSSVLTLLYFHFKRWL